MKIYPAIDILQGKAVRLRQGRPEDATVYGVPLQMAGRWFHAGAGWLHVVDLDGAFDGVPRNHEAIVEIARMFPALKIQVGGGIRNMATVEGLFSGGIQRVVLGTSAVSDPTFVRAALGQYGNRIAIGIDARDGVVRTAGWTEDAHVGAIELAQKLESAGASLVIYTDIARDGVLSGPNIEALDQMLRQTSLHVIASGGVSKIDDVRALAAMDNPRLDGVIIGKALYEGVVRLEEALALGCAPMDGLRGPHGGKT
jgi:phosphoribosylformimino-5-aminoimidazole carboxamide ribotide isomerase